MASGFSGDGGGMEFYGGAGRSILGDTGTVIKSDNKIFNRRYPTPGYPRTLDPDKDSKIMDPPDKDPDPDTLKLSGYLILPRPSAGCFALK
ncbi:hypothetical protein F2Q68_00019584 [Brassica cretica]|uniref:Uncharacterized protein n=1 Tax=Brassica cretica TaxID=69181 RepID=A0A8S9FWZ1_BRACR|nr:hypothetical protein F2Q68_00019584 [Brassica cretica]